MRRDPQVFDEALALLGIDYHNRWYAELTLQSHADDLTAAKLKPQLRDITARLRKIEKMATQLAQMISEHDLDLADAFEDSIPLGFVFVREGLLQEIAALANGMHDRLVGEYGFGAPLRVLIHGTDKRRFVTRVACLWAHYKGYEGLSAYESGALAQFVLKCWQWAMGSEEMSGLDRDLKSAVRGARAWLRLKEEGSKVRVENTILRAKEAGIKSPQALGRPGFWAERWNTTNADSARGVRRGNTRLRASTPSKKRKAARP